MLQNGDVKKLVQLLDNDSLDYSRYGDVFGEVILAGNIVEPGGSLRSAPTPHCVFENETEEKATIGVEAMHQIMRRKPFLRARFDAVVSKLLICLSTFGDNERHRFAFAVGLMLSRNMVRFFLWHFCLVWDILVTSGWGDEARVYIVWCTGSYSVPCHGRRRTVCQSLSRPSCLGRSVSDGHWVVCSGLTSFVLVPVNSVVHLADFTQRPQPAEDEQDGGGERPRPGFHDPPDHLLP